MCWEVPGMRDSRWCKFPELHFMVYHLSSKPLQVPIFPRGIRRSLAKVSMDKLNLLVTPKCHPARRRPPEGQLPPLEAWLLTERCPSDTLSVGFFMSVHRSPFYHWVGRLDCYRWLVLCWGPDWLSCWHYFKAPVRLFRHGFALALSSWIHFGSFVMDLLAWDSWVFPGLFWMSIALVPSSILGKSPFCQSLARWGSWIMTSSSRFWNFSGTGGEKPRCWFPLVGKVLDRNVSRQRFVAFIQFYVKCDSLNGVALVNRLLGNRVALVADSGLGGTCCQ